MPFSVVFLLALMLPAQNSSQQEPGQFRLAPLWTSLQSPQVQQQFRDYMEKRREELQSHTCLALRVFHFERNDGKAPVLVNTVTCTPSNIFTQKAGHPPRPMFVPLKLNY